MGVDAVGNVMLRSFKRASAVSAAGADAFGSDTTLMINPQIGINAFMSSPPAWVGVEQFALERRLERHRTLAMYVATLSRHVFDIAPFKVNSRGVLRNSKSLYR